MNYLSEIALDWCD